MTDLAADLTPGLYAQQQPRGDTSMQSDDHILYTREARRSGRIVLTLRCSRRGDRFVVECDTHNVSAAADAAPKRRAFAFRERAAAERFSVETLRALECLGCQVS